MVPDDVVQTHGMGVDSAAWTTAVLLGDAPEPPGFDPANLTVVTAMTGWEYDATEQAMNEHHLPLLEAHGVRYVQIARAGWSETDGITVLSDTGRGDPYKMVMRGTVNIQDWFLRAGTIPQTNSRDCSYWAKGWPLDTYFRTTFGDTPRRHVVGFAAEEELTRAVRDESYSRKMAGKHPWYPLIEWGWDRQRCLDYLRDVYGIEWPRSCCKGCCYQYSDRVGLKLRWRREPEAARESVAMERNALALNPNAKLFKDHTADRFARDFGLGDVADQAAAELDGRRHALYEVRRIYRRLGDHRAKTGAREWVLGPDPNVRATKGSPVWRSLRTIAEGTRDEMVAALRREAAQRGGRLDITDRWARLITSTASKDGPWPATTEGLAVAVAGADKERDAFPSLWEFVQAFEATQERQGDLFDDFDIEAWARLVRETT